jgi:hypothetical protein
MHYVFWGLPFGRLTEIPTIQVVPVYLLIQV